MVSQLCGSISGANRGHSYMTLSIAFVRTIKRFPSRLLQGPPSLRNGDGLRFTFLPGYGKIYGNGNSERFWENCFWKRAQEKWNFESM